MIGNIIGTIVNIILDPIMILNLKMGVKGAALATVMGNVFAVVYFILYIIRKSKILSISIKDLSINKSIINGIMIVGIPASINNILMSISYIFVNNYLKVYGDSAIGAMGIAHKVVSLVTLLLIGFAAGLQPLLGYAYGAKNNKRLNEILKFAFYAVVIGGLVGGVIIFIFANNIIKIFIGDKNIINYGTSMLRGLMLGTPICGIIFVLGNLFQAMGKGRQSMIIAVSKQGLVFIPVIAIMNKILGLNGIIISQALTDVITTIIAVLMFISIRKEENLHLDEELDINL